MNLELRKGKNDNEFLAYESEKVVGKGYFYTSLSSDIYEEKRYNIFIGIISEDIEVKDFIYEEFLKIAKQYKNKHSDKQVRFYHCCLSNKVDSINYYKSKGLDDDEGMHVLRHELKQIPTSTSVDDIYIIRGTMEIDLEKEQFINKHKKVFRNTYTIDDINELKSQKDFMSFGCVYEGELIGNVFVYTKYENNQKIGWVDDLFVSRRFRKKGIAQLLMIEVLNYFKSLELNESRLELWSSNKRATSLYKKIGYEFFKETQVSIGKFL